MNLQNDERSTYSKLFLRADDSWCFTLSVERERDVTLKLGCINSEILRRHGTYHEIGYLSKVVVITATDECQFTSNGLFSYL